MLKISLKLVYGKEIKRAVHIHIRLPKRVWIDERWSPKWGVTKIVIFGDFHSITRVTMV